MDRESKLRFHLEEIVLSDQPDGTRVNAAQMNALADSATEEQKARAYARALKHVPLLLDDEK